MPTLGVFTTISYVFMHFLANFVEAKIVAVLKSTFFACLYFLITG